MLLACERGLLPPSPTSTLLLSVSLSSKPIRVWVPGTARKGLSVTTMKGFPKQASHIQAFQMCGWRPGCSISRKAATSFDKTLLVLTPPWLRESGWVCAGGQVEVGRGGKKGNIWSFAEISGTWSSSCLHRAFQTNSGFQVASKKKKRLHQRVQWNGFLVSQKWYRAVLVLLVSSGLIS